MIFLEAKFCLENELQKEIIVTADEANGITLSVYDNEREVCLLEEYLSDQDANELVRMLIMGQEHVKNGGEAKWKMN